MRELTYELPQQRLRRLSRSMGRKAFPRSWRTKWMLLFLFIVVMLPLLGFRDELIGLAAAIGLPPALMEYANVAVFGLAFVLIFSGIRLIGRSQRREAKARVNFGATAHLVQDENGIAIAGEGIEYRLKWAGISQMLIEPDGIVLSHGSLFWLIPDAAFAGPEDRLGFIRDVYSRLGEQARAISRDQIEPLLAREGGTTAA
jgi:YcxB-like protein